MFTYTIPLWLQSLFPALTWKVKTDRREVYITFDDGPHPEITPWVMEQLNRVNAKATFFCVGENVTRFPDTFQPLTQNGHTVGNHTFNHLNGWKTEDKVYFSNIEKGAEVIRSNLFRPPYGRISLSQIREVKKQYKIIMWDILTGDFVQGLDQQRRMKEIKETIKPGSVIVFHDSVKAEKNLKVMLPEILDFCVNEGYTFACFKLTN